MPINSAGILKIIGERETKTKQKKEEESKNEGETSYSERMRDKWFCWAFKLNFLQLICQASLIFKWNLELALSSILKERELHEPKHVEVECRYLRIWDFLSFSICSSILVLKWRQLLPI